MAEPKVIEDNDKYTIMVKATNMETKAEMYGGATQMKKDDFGNVDKFAFQKCLSKAQRNAIRTLIPEKFAAALIDNQLKTGEKVKKLEPAKPKPKQKSQPKPANGFKTADKVKPGEDLATTGQVDALLMMANQIGGLEGHGMVTDYLHKHGKKDPGELTGTEIGELGNELRQVLDSRKTADKAPP